MKMSLRSLYSKLALILLGLFCLVGVIFMVLILLTADYYQKEVNQKLNRNLARNIAADMELLVGGSVNETALEELFHDLMVINPSIELYLLDPDGGILTYSAPPGKVRLRQVDLGPIRRWLTDEPTYPLLGDDPRHPGRKKPFSAARITAGGGLEGYLYIILGGEEFDHTTQQIGSSYILQIGLWLVLAGLLFALVAGLILFGFLTRRLKRLTIDMDAYKRGLQPPSDPKGLEERDADEIERLRRAFHGMAHRIERQITALHRSESLRRELETNVYHDLRSPLTTLRSYLESVLIRDDSLSREHRREQLETAVKHCEKLGRLVNELFELAKLDSGEIEPSTAPLPLRDLVGDVVQKFRPRARHGQVAIDLRSDGSPAVAHIDPAMMERALDNLLDNGLRHTPAGGRVTISLNRAEDRCVLEIGDTGPGIPPEDLPHIFDRYYRPDRNWHPMDNGAGLGLSIAKRIIELHSGDIQVRSQVDEGTTFTITLPAAGTALP